MTLAEGWSKADMRALSKLLDDESESIASTATLEHLRRLVPARQAAILERDEASHRLVCVAGVPVGGRSHEGIQRAIDNSPPEHVLTLCLATPPRREARLVFLRDDPNFTEVDKITLALLRPHIVAAYRRASERRAGARRLTPRQREVLHLVARGYHNDEIASRLVVSPGTVRKHLDNAYRQLGVSGRAAAVARAFPEGLTPYVGGSS